MLQHFFFNFLFLSRIGRQTTNRFEHHSILCADRPMACIIPIDILHAGAILKRKPLPTTNTLGNAMMRLLHSMLSLLLHWNLLIWAFEVNKLRFPSKCISHLSCIFSLQCVCFWYNFYIFAAHFLRCEW